jgi:hypothetical protein
MMNKTKLLKLTGLLVMGALLIGALALWAFPEQVDARGGQGNGGGRQAVPAGQGQGIVVPGGGQGQGMALSSAPAGELSEAEAQALAAALDDEYHAWAIYDQVLQDLGNVRPFAGILRSEESHIAALVRLFERYDLEIPANPWLGNVPSFDTVPDACAASVQAEVDNAGLYDELFGAVDNSDILQVFAQLQRASETRHLSAFERCAP